MLPIRLFTKTFHTTTASSLKKLILVFAEDTSQVSLALAKRIESELKAVHLNAFRTEQLVTSAQVPYSVVITKRTLEDGVVELQHFEPRIKEEVHVSQLSERLLLQTGAESALRCIKSA